MLSSRCKKLELNQYDFETRNKELISHCQMKDNEVSTARTSLAKAIEASKSAKREADRLRGELAKFVGLRERISDLEGERDALKKAAEDQALDLEDAKALWLEQLRSSAEFKKMMTDQYVEGFEDFCALCVGKLADSGIDFANLDFEEEPPCASTITPNVAVQSEAAAGSAVAPQGVPDGGPPQGGGATSGV